MYKAHRPLEIMLVEDSLSDVDLITEMLEESNIKHNIHIVRDGEDAMLFLYQQGHHKDVARPDIILLDLNLPKKNGHEVLSTIKSDSQLRRIPVIIFTTSELRQDVLRAYDMHANAYMLKSDNFDELLRTIQSVENYWLSTVKLSSTL